MKFLPWEYLEDGVGGKDLSTENRLNWFRSVCKGWRIVPDDIRVIPFGKNNEKVTCVMVVSIFDDKGRKMASYPHSGVFGNEDGKELYDQNFVSTIFDVAVDEALTMLGFTVTNAIMMQRQFINGQKGASSGAPAAQPGKPVIGSPDSPQSNPDNMVHSVIPAGAGITTMVHSATPFREVATMVPSVTPSEAGVPAEEYIDRLNVIFKLMKNKGLLKKIDSLEDFAEKVVGIQKITKDNYREIERELTDALKELKNTGGDKN